MSQLSLFGDDPAAPGGGASEPRPSSGRRTRVGAAPPPTELAELAPRLPDGLHLGTSSWSFPGWSGFVWDRPYSTRKLAREGLAAYARHPLLTGVGVDRTYYAPLPAEDFAAYAAAVPDSFRFVVKAHEACTVQRWPEHPRYGSRRGETNPLFLDASYAAQEVVAPLVEGLGEKAGALVFQFAPQDLGPMGGVRAFIDRVHDFLADLPTGPRYAVELRNKEVLGPTWAAALQSAGAVHCLNVHPRMPDLGTQARDSGALQGSALVIRWMLGGDLDYEQARRRYEPFDRLVDEDPARRRTVAALTLETTAAERPAFVIANNKAEGCAPQTLFRLAELIASLRSRPTP